MRKTPGLGIDDVVQKLVNDGDGNIDRYIEYTAYRDGVDLEEAARRSLARLFGTIAGGTNSPPDWTPSGSGGFASSSAGGCRSASMPRGGWAHAWRPRRMCLAPYAVIGGRRCQFDFRGGIVLRPIDLPR